jgi:hypothetical protein
MTVLRFSVADGNKRTGKTGQPAKPAQPLFYTYFVEEGSQAPLDTPFAGQPRGLNVHNRKTQS